MKEGGKGGGNTQSGLEYEGKVDLLSFLQKHVGYEVHDQDVYFEGKYVAKVFKQSQIYKFLESNNVSWQDHISKRLYPDNSILVFIKNTIYIIEVKFQKVQGSVDEKLQTCDFKKKQYRKLFSPLNIDVEYIYLLNNWFRDKKYKDVLDYIISVDCHYYFEFIPLEKLGLPVKDRPK